MLTSRRLPTRALAALTAIGALAAVAVPATSASAAPPPVIKHTGKAKGSTPQDYCGMVNTPVGQLNEDQLNGALLCAINTARTSNGVARLVYAPPMVFMGRSALAHAHESVAGRNWTTWQSSHMEPGATGDYNQQITNRILGTGYCRGKSAQTSEITYTQSDGATVMSAVNWWMSDPPHRATVLNGSLKAGGFAGVHGYAQQDGYTPGPNAGTFVVDFGSCNGSYV